MKNVMKPLVLSMGVLGLITLMPVYAATSTGAKTAATHTSSKKTKQAQSTPATDGATEAQVSTPVGPAYLPVDLDVPGQSFVSTGPYIGVPLAYSGYNLIVNSPSINEDIALLEMRKSINLRLEALGRSADTKGSHVLLSGVLEGQALYQNGGGNNTQTSTNLTEANLDAYILGPSSWTSGLIELAYDNNIGTQTGSFSSNDATLNSRVYVNKAFVVIGDFQQSPFYGSFGQMYVPFGVYATTLVSSPVTKIMARTQARAALLGYKEQTENPVYASAYMFSGASHASSTSNINNGGLNVGYKYKMKNVLADVGGGVIANIADSQGMQYTGNNNDSPPLFGGFGGPTETYTNAGTVTQINTGNEKLVHRVPAYNLHALVGVGENVQLIGEYVAASTNFSSADMTVNSHGARPQAIDAEGVYNLPWFEKPTSLSLSYQASWDGLAIGLPAKRYSFVVNRSFWKDTVQSLELRHDINYSGSNTSTGSSIAGPSGTGRSANVITLQCDYYF